MTDTGLKDFHDSEDGNPRSVSAGSPDSSEVVSARIFTAPELRAALRRVDRSLLWSVFMGDTDPGLTMDILGDSSAPSVRAGIVALLEFADPIGELGLPFLWSEYNPDVLVDIILDVGRQLREFRGDGSTVMEIAFPSMVWLRDKIEACLLDSFSRLLSGEIVDPLDVGLRCGECNLQPYFGIMDLDSRLRLAAALDIAQRTGSHECGPYFRRSITSGMLMKFSDRVGHLRGWSIGRDENGWPIWALGTPTWRTIDIIASSSRGLSASTRDQ